MRGRLTRRTLTGLLAGLTLLAAGACSAQPPPTPAAPPTRSPFSGLVDVGGGRQLYLQCRGSGTPTVVLVSGAAGAHDDWTYVLDTAESTPTPRPSGSAVFEEVARFTRVCAYDRPGTTLFTGALSPSTPVAQPTTAQAGVSDLQALLVAADEPGPYVVVGASWGGMIVNLFARTRASEVTGLVFVDAASNYLKETLSPEQWTAWMSAVKGSAVSPQGEVPDYEAAVAEIDAAPQTVPAVPASVLTAEKPWNLPVGDAGPTWPAWIEAQSRLATFLHAQHVTQTGSGHAINLEQPRIVVEAIRRVVDEARAISPAPR